MDTFSFNAENKWEVYIPWVFLAKTKKKRLLSPHKEDGVLVGDNFLRSTEESHRILHSGLISKNWHISPDTFMGELCQHFLQKFKRREWFFNSCYRIATYNVTTNLSCQCDTPGKREWDRASNRWASGQVCRAILVCLFWFGLLFVCLVVRLFVVLRQYFLVQPWLSCNSLCKAGWPWTHRYPPVSASQELGLKVYTTTSLLWGYFLDC